MELSRLKISLDLYRGTLAAARSSAALSGPQPWTQTRSREPRTLRGWRTATDWPCGPWTVSWGNIMKRKQPKALFFAEHLDALAETASRVLYKYGSENPDWKEWRYLKDALLRIQGELSPDTAKIVGSNCGAYIQALHADLDQRPKPMRKPKP